MGGGNREGRRGAAPAAESAVVPMSAVDAVVGTLESVDELNSNLRQFLSVADADSLADLPPLHRARAFLVLAKAVTELFSVRLRCSGICPDDHPVGKELERLSLYQDKLERFNDWSRAPLRPSASLNCKAATRFIAHSLPDLTQEQRKNLRDISQGNYVSIRSSNEQRAKKKRKQQFSERQSSRAAAQEFLEKATRELLRSGNGGVKGPLLETSDSDEE